MRGEWRSNVKKILNPDSREIFSAEGLHAGDQIVFGGGGGAEAPDNGAAIGGFVGKNLGSKVRVEGELVYRQNDMNMPGAFPG